MHFAVLLTQFSEPTTTLKLLFDNVSPINYKIPRIVLTCIIFFKGPTFKNGRWTQ